MTMDHFATQQSIFNFLTAEAGFAVYDTELPQAKDEPVSPNGYPMAYAVIRWNDVVRTPQGGAVGGARYDESYSLIDVLCVGPTPDEARTIAYGVDGVNDILTGFRPVDAGTLSKAGGGQVFVVGDGTATVPRRVIARCSFRYSANMSPSE